MKTRGIVEFSKLIEPDTKYDPQWYVRLNIDKAEAMKLKKVGLSPTLILDEEDEPTGRYRIKFFRRVAKRGATGGTNPAPDVLDPGMIRFTGIVGNGSEVIVLHKPYIWNNKHGKGVGTDLAGVQVVKLVPYEPEDKEGEESIPDADNSFEVIGESFAEQEEQIKESGLFDEGVKDDDNEDF